MKSKKWIILGWVTLMRNWLPVFRYFIRRIILDWSFDIFFNLVKLMLKLFRIININRTSPGTPHHFSWFLHVTLFQTHGLIYIFRSARSYMLVYPTCLPYSVFTCGRICRCFWCENYWIAVMQICIGYCHLKVCKVVLRRSHKLVRFKIFLIKWIQFFHKLNVWSLSVFYYFNPIFIIFVCCGGMWGCLFGFLSSFQLCLIWESE